MALTYIRIESSALLDAAVTAVVCGVGTFCLYYSGLGRLAPLAAPVLFLLAAFVVSLQRKENRGDAVLAFLLGQGGYSFLAFTGKAAFQSAGIAGSVLACLMPALFAFLTYRLRGLFPSSDWRDYYTKAAPEPGRIQLKLVHNYLITAWICAVMTVGVFVLTTENMTEFLFWSAAGMSLYWSAVLFLIIINAYKRERIAVLVEQQYRDEMQGFLNVIRSQRHDYNFHVQTIAGLIREGKIEECKNM